MPDPAPPAYRIAHLSDVHFGRIDSPAIVDALVGEVNAAAKDLVVVSGDLTQRARREQFLAARAFLDRFDAPVLVVPGNHDVPAWWHNPFARVFRSARKYQHFIEEDLTPTFASARDGLPPLSVLGLNSAHGLTIKGGLLRSSHREEIRTYFQAQPTNAMCVLVLHHHLRLLETIGKHDVARGAAATLDAAADAGVDLVLCGHVHKSTVEHLMVTTTHGHGQRLVIASAGTATSNRSREDEGRRTNYYNWITVEADRFTIEERRFWHAGKRYRAVRQSEFHLERTEG